MEHYAKPREERKDRKWFLHPAVLSVGLLVLSLVLYWEVQYFLFVGLDDHIYVWNNPTVLTGLTVAGVQDVFSRPIHDTYVPLTWVSLMADSSFFGRTESSYHRTSVLLHCANTILLFLFLRRGTGTVLPAAFVAGMFAVHPLNVESVAWVSSRKDVLSGFFWLLGCWIYCAIPAARVYWRIGLVTAAYVFGLLAKPSMIALPFALLLLDYWPLGRFGTPPSLQSKTILRMILEKIPLFAVLVASMGVTFYSAAGSLGMNEAIRLTTRMGDTVVNYALYLAKFFVPFNLSPQYPYVATGWPGLAIAGSILGLVAVTALAWMDRERWPFVAVGWLWFLSVMAPLSGIIIVGAHSRADRYMYIPMIGLAIMIAWTCVAFAAPLRSARTLLRAAGVAAVLGYAVAGWLEIPHWENEKKLAAHMLASHAWSPMGHFLMGKALEAEGDIAGGLKHYQEQLKLVPGDPSGYVAIGNTQIRLSENDNAVFWYRKALEVSPDYDPALLGLGIAEAKRGNFDQAKAHVERCVQIDPNDTKARYVLEELRAGRAPNVLP